MKWLSAADIDNWTDKDPRRAQETLPLLVWKLITATYPHIIDSHFPYGKAVQFSGYDGGLTLEVGDALSFCPGGKSVWEMGTDKDIFSKFNGDYKKRTETPNGINTSETTFLFCDLPNLELQEGDRRNHRGEKQGKYLESRQDFRCQFPGAVA